jgi:hypothetical protein
MSTRREFLQTTLRAGLALPASGLLGHLAARAARAGVSDDDVTAAQALLSLARRFPDLSRHFLFEYYPWYATDPIRHWDQWDRVPPHDIAATSVPRLGAYDSRSTAVLESHARWIVESGAGGVNLSWWGPGSFEDRAVHQVMDVFRAHDLKVAFHLEPYDDDRGRRYADDVLYLLREFGERRRFDAFLVLRNADGSEGPVFKGFRTIVPREYVDCHGVTREISDHTPNAVWQRQTDRLRSTLRGDFHHVTLLADSLDFESVRASGFDGISIYDNFVPPSSYAEHARGASALGLVFSFNTNPGYDGIEPRDIEPGGCYSPTPFDPPAEGLDFRDPGGRERAAALSESRIRESFASTLAVQRDPALANARNGFFLVYVTSFNEWHEGHAFEPMKDAAELTRQERAVGYHNPARGSYRLDTITGLIRATLAASPALALPA